MIILYTYLVYPILCLINFWIALILVNVVLFRLKWAVRVPASQRPDPLNNRHNDYLWPFNWIPRSWTAFFGEPPRQIAGTNPKDHHADIPADGTWSLTLPFHFAIVTKSQWLVHVGLRFDYQSNGEYYNADFTIKNLKRYR